MSVNVESVGLGMVIREKEWILDQFGIAPCPGATGPSEKVPATILCHRSMTFRVDWPTSSEASRSRCLRGILRFQQPVMFCRSWPINRGTDSLKPALKLYLGTPSICRRPRTTETTDSRGEASAPATAPPIVGRAPLNLPSPTRNIFLLCQ